MLAPPPRPGLMQRIGDALAQRPVILPLIVVALAVVATVIIRIEDKHVAGRHLEVTLQEGQFHAFDYLDVAGL